MVDQTVVIGMASFDLRQFAGDVIIELKGSFLCFLCKTIGELEKPLR